MFPNCGSRTTIGLEPYAGGPLDTSTSIAVNTLHVLFDSNLNGQHIPQRETAKYLGIHLDRRLTWQKHIFTKRKQLGLQLHRMYWIIGRKSKLSLENKLLIYKTIRFMVNVVQKLRTLDTNTHVYLWHCIAVIRL